MSLSFGHVAAVAKDFIFATAVLDAYEEEDVCHTVMLEYRGASWGYWEANTRIIGVHLSLRNSEPQFFGLGFSGDYQERSNNGVSWGRIGSGLDMPSTLRRLTCLRRIDNEIFVAGMGRQVFRRPLSGGSWSRADAGALIPRDVFEMNGFTSIDGFSTGELYACGLLGHVWCDRGRGWSRMVTPTNVTLSVTRCLPSGSVLVGGAGGTLLEGRGEHWRVIEHDATASGFVNIESIGPQVFVTTDQCELFELRGDDLIPVDTGLDPKPMTLTMHAQADFLVSAGGRDIIVYEAGNWSRLEAPF